MRCSPHVALPRPIRPFLVAGGALAAMVGLSSCDDGSATGEVAAGRDLRPRVVGFCETHMARLDCDCFWEEAAPAFNAGNVGPILAALGERDQYGPMLTRGRLERFAGEEETRRIGRALYDCVDLKQ